MTRESVDLLYEDNHCLVVNKPAGWLTMGDATGDRTLLDICKEDVARRYHKPGAVFLGVVHRLDRPVSGVILFARTSKGASRLSEQFREHRIEKVYWAAVTGKVPDKAGVLEQELVKDRQTNQVRVVPAATAASQSCRLAYRKLGEQGSVTVVEIRPETGRSHQIRVQLASQGWSIIGDRKYGNSTSFVTGQIALHARSLTFEHPVKKEPITVTCPPPPTWKAWRTLLDDR